MAVAETVTVPATVVPEIGATMATVGGVLSGRRPVSSGAGTLTRKASRRPRPMLLVQMKYWPVTSRLPFGSFESLSPTKFMSVITGATTRTRKEPSSGKQMTSFARGRFTRLAPPPHAYCCSGGTPDVVLA